MAQVARVLPEVAALDRPFDYALDDGAVAHVGERVRVDLHGRSVRGWIVGLAEHSDVADLKPLSKRLGLGPSAAVVELCKWAAWRWAGPWSKLLATASPSRLAVAPVAVPPARALPEVHNQLRVLGGRLVRQRRPSLVTLGPCADPLDLVVAVLHGVRDEGLDGAVVVTTPTAAWATRLAARLVRRGVLVADLAGADQWVEAASGYPVVLGTRAAAFAPVERIAAAVVLDAHDEAYRQTQAPCWSAVDVLAERARRDGAPLVATSWCASPTLLALATSTEPFGHQPRQWPRVVTHDLSVADPREQHLSSVFAQIARRALDDDVAGVRVAVVLQRLGGARLLACRACGALARCEPHDLALRDGEGGLGCPAGCTAVPKVCRACGALRLVAVREGTAALAKRVAALLNTEVAEVTASSGDVPADVRVVVGTEAVLARVRHAGVVCFADLDDYLCAPRAHASLAALRAIGLAGRLVGARGDAVPGTVVVQTRLPDHPVVQAAVRGEPQGVVSAEADAARALGLPPYVAACALHGPGAAPYAAALARDGLTITGSDERYLVVAATHKDLCDALAETARGDERLRVEVDPPDG